MLQKHVAARLPVCGQCCCAVWSTQNCVIPCHVGLVDLLGRDETLLAAVVGHTSVQRTVLPGI